MLDGRTALGFLSTKVRYFGDDFLKANLRQALDSGYKKVWLIDAAINFANGPLERLAGAVREVDPLKSLKFWYFLQWANYDERQLKSLEAFGVDTIHIGLESANPETLRLAGRNWDEAKVRACVRGVSQLATPVIDVILGMPGDTVDSFRRTLDFAVSLDVNIMAFRLMIIPGSLYDRRAQSLGVRIRPGRMPFVAETPTMKESELEHLTELVAQMAYFNPANKRYFLHKPADYWGGGAPVVASFQK